MTAQAASEQWAVDARDALDSAQKLFASKKFHHALFFCHLAVEKALKARYITDNDELPPYTHDLVVLGSKTTLNFSPDQIEELAKINTFNIAGRYREEKLALFNQATESFAGEWLQRTELILKSII